MSRDKPGGDTHAGISLFPMGCMSAVGAATTVNAIFAYVYPSTILEYNLTYQNLGEN